MYARQLSAGRSTVWYVAPKLMKPVVLAPGGTSETVELHEM